MSTFDVIFAMVFTGAILLLTFAVGYCFGRLDEHKKLDMKTYKLGSVLNDVADALICHPHLSHLMCPELFTYQEDHSATTIRDAINRRVEKAERDGFAVNHDYDQGRAVARVKEMIRNKQVEVWEQVVRDLESKA